MVRLHHINHTGPVLVQHVLSVQQDIHLLLVRTRQHLGTCNVTITPFSGVSGNYSCTLAVGQSPMSPQCLEGTINPGISASTIQINREGCDECATGSYSDLSIDTSGNVVMGGSSSARYKTNLSVIEKGRYMDLLKLNTYTFNYKD